MKATRTPGRLFLVRRVLQSWQVVSVDERQGAAARLRGEPHVYETSRQAYAVRNRLRKEKHEVV